MIGELIGHFEILDHLGKGGMGEVFRARDTKLDREVAIKVLPSELAADGDRLERLEREARLLASLHHPRIASIYGLEVKEGRPCLVLELIEGEDLAQRLIKGRLTLDEALPIALQITEGLEAAHENGIVHRDLKPANVMLDADDQVKILDFGLARSDDRSTSSVDLSASPTKDVMLTRAGVILGTAHYMSPEQARGKVVDKRTDIWAFGCVLFELLTGRRAFAGEDIADILSAVLRAEPELELLSADLPPRLRQLVEHCLRKDPRRRLRDIGDARIVLEELIAGSGSDERLATAALPRRSSLPWALVTILTIAVGVLSLMQVRSSSSAIELPVRASAIDLPWQQAPNWADFEVVLSPLGDRLAYNCREGNRVSLCLRSLDSLEVEKIVAARDVSRFFFSADGEWVGLLEDSLTKISIHGGAPRTIVDREEIDRFDWVRGFAWGDDGTILVGTSAGLHRVDAGGGKLVRISAAETSAKGMSHPSRLPGGSQALVRLRLDNGSVGALVDLQTGAVTKLDVPGRFFAYVGSGHLLFAQGSTVFAASFDPAKPGEIGEPVPVLEDYRHSLQIAADGTMVYIPVRGESSARLVWVDREGRPTPIAGERRNYSHLDLSPDGSKAALNIGGVFVLDLERGARSRIADGNFPIWSSDGERVAFRASEGIEVQSVDGGGAALRLVDSNHLSIPTSWNAATGDIAYYDHRDYQLKILPPQGELRIFHPEGGRKRSGRFSPDGNWMAFVDDVTGEYQVYVSAYPGPGQTVAVSVDGGLSPIWSAAGDEIFFRLGSKVMASAVEDADGTLTVGAPIELFDGPYTLDLMGHQRYDVAADGSFLMVENSDDFRIVLIQNWPLELEERVSPGD